MRDRDIEPPVNISLSFEVMGNGVVGAFLQVSELKGHTSRGSETECGRKVWGVGSDTPTARLGTVDSVREVERREGVPGASASGFLLAQLLTRAFPPRLAPAH